MNDSANIEPGKLSPLPERFRGSSRTEAIWAEESRQDKPAIPYLSRSEVARRVGVKPDTLGRYKLPAPDATIGRVRGWFPETIDEWHRNRPKPRTQGTN